MSEIHEQRTDLPQALEKAVAEASGLAGDKPVTVIAEYPAHLPAVRVGRYQVVQMLVGVIGSVVKAVDAGEVTVSAEILPDPEDGPGPWAVVNIRFPRSPQAAQQALQLAMVLEDESTDDASELPSIRSLAQSLGGDLWLEGPESEQPGLMLSLPLLATQHGQGDIRSIVESHIAQDPDGIETLLIHVEDPTRLEMMSEELGDEGYRIVTTSDGSEVLALARQERPI